MTFSSFFARYWRIPVVALLGALIAFAGSFMTEPTYASSTRLLIRGREATFLTNTGQDLTRQPGVIDSSLSKTLAETEAGVATSREVATMVVDRLALDKPKEEQGGILAGSVHAVGSIYGCTKAIITHGFCKDPEPREKAIQGVQEGLLAGQLGATSGDGAGQPGSYILELVGSGTSPEQARDITNAAADALVQVSANRFKQDAQQHADLLGAQAKVADQQVQDAATAIGDYKTAHGISDVDAQVALSTTSAEDLRTQLRKVEVDLTGAQAQLNSLNASIAATNPNQQSEQEILTGRSNNRVTTNAPSAVYSDLVAQRENLTAVISSLQAQQAALQNRLAGVAPAALSQDQVALVSLDQKLKLAKDNQATLTQQYQEALANAQSNTVELTRIDQASTPTYPVAPKRYLYLVLGLLIGGLAGGGLTWLARRRELAELGGADPTVGGSGARGADRDGVLDLRDDEAIDLSEAADAEHDYALAGTAGAGRASGSSLFARGGTGTPIGKANGNGTDTGAGANP